MLRSKMSIPGVVLVIALLLTPNQYPLFAGPCEDYHDVDYNDGKNWRDYCSDDYAELMDEHMDTSRRNRTFRIVQKRGDMNAPHARHSQYDHACGFFALAPIVEYLGYSRFERFASWSKPFRYMGADNSVRWQPFNVGYFGSPEHLISQFYYSETGYRCIAGTEGSEIYPCGFFRDEDESKNCDKNSADRLSIDDLDRNCNRFFKNGQEYGQCQNLGALNPDNVPDFLRRAGLFATDGNWNDDQGMFRFVNTVMASNTPVGIAGCNDARGFKPSNASEKIALRKIIKGFIDNNVPLPGVVNNSGHFQTIVGYANLDQNGVPETAIMADSVGLVYWDVDLTEWNIADRWSPHSIIPWNHHLDGGCDPGGWARALDEDPSIPAKFRLCTLAGAPAYGKRQAQRFYGVNIQCFSNNGRKISEHYAPVEDPFIRDWRNISCDKVHLYYADGEHRVVAAKAHRYRFNFANARWERISSYNHNAIDEFSPSNRLGPRTKIVFDRAWRDNYWIVANYIGGDTSHPQRRTAFELTLSNGETRWIELTPARQYFNNTYGITLATYEDGNRRPTWNHHEYPRRSVFPVNRTDYVDHCIIPRRGNNSCDKLRLMVSLGQGNRVHRAEAHRYYYTNGVGWRPANRTWEPNSKRTSNRGLNGGTIIFDWDGAWRDNSWISAKNVGGRNGNDRKTNIRLYDEAGAMLREIEIVPY